MFPDLTCLNPSSQEPLSRYAEAMAEVLLDLASLNLTGIVVIATEDETITSNGGLYVSGSFM